MDSTELEALYARAQAELGRIPGVVAVGFGLKEVDDVTTDTVAIRVYVAAKKPSGALGPEERIPALFEGVPTDVVLPVDDQPLHCEDLAEHDPLVGGITISNLYDEVGTLGFFATINGEDGWDNVVAVSNNHVLAAFSSKRGDRVFQPKLRRNQDGTINPVDPAKKNPIGKIHKAGLEGVHPFTFPGGQQEVETFVDCATARLDICVSSWCHFNCGISYKNAVDRLTINGSSRIADVGRIVVGDVGTDRAIVYKTGRKTGFTKGRVVEVFGPRDNGPGKVMIIEPEGTDCDGIPQFADKGDSGAPILDGGRKLVALLYARSGKKPKQILACHIEPVLDYLDISAITEENPPKGPAGEARADLHGLMPLRTTSILRERLCATARGRAVYESILAHRAEVVALINRCRPVTVAWHRAKGPAFANRAVANAGDPAVPLPREIEGVTREALTRRIAKALQADGSQALRTAIGTHRDGAIACLRTCDDLGELADRLAGDPGPDEQQEVPCGAG